MAVYGIRYKEAEELRKQEYFQEAAAIFRDLWSEHSSVQVGSRWVYCLRKLNNYQEAIEVARQAIEQFPKDQWLLREYAWCIYFQEVKPSLSKCDLGRIIRFAQEMLELSDDEIIRKQAVFAVIDVAKERTKWDIVSSWCDKLDPSLLSVESISFREQKSMPDRERWYFAKIKATVQLKQWDQVLQYTHEAIAFFPRKDDFSRWLAQARAAQGDVASAVEIIERLLHKGNAQWYILMDLALMKQSLSQNQEALQLACKAALAFGEDKAKVNLFLLLAELGLACGHEDFTAYHVALTKAIRIREGWPVRGELVSLEKRVQTALPNDTSSITLPLDIRSLFSWCQNEWHKYTRLGKPRYTGKICSLPDGKKFAFILPDTGGENVFVILRDLPRTAQTVGIRVEYSLEQSFDPKKNRESVRAVEVSLIS